MKPLAVKTSFGTSIDLCEDPKRERTTSLWLALGPQPDKGVDWFSKPIPPPSLLPSSTGHFKSETWSSSLECGAVLSGTSKLEIVY